VVEAGCRMAVSRVVKADWIAVERGEGRVGGARARGRRSTPLRVA
jgi:hypothetical protein